MPLPSPPTQDSGLRTQDSASLHHAFLSEFSRIGVDNENGVLHGVIVASKGEAKGHGLYLGDAALDELAKLKSVPFRVDPPGREIHGGAMAIEGEAANFRRDGDDVRADVTLFDLPGGARARVIKLAQSAAHFIGMSLDLSYRVVGIAAGNLKEIVPNIVRSIDLVTNPASARALFQDPSTLNPQPSTSSTPPVDIPIKDNMDYTFLRAQCARFSIEFPAADKDVTAELAQKAQAALVAKLDAQSAQLSRSEGHLAKLKASGVKFCGGCGAPMDEDCRCESCNSIVDPSGKYRTFFQKKDDGTFETVKLAELTTIMGGKKAAPNPEPRTANPPPPAAPAALLTEKDLDAIVAKLQAKGLASVGGKTAKPDGDGAGDGAPPKLKPAVLALARHLHSAKLSTIEAGNQARFVEEKAREMSVALSALSPEEQNVCLDLKLDPLAFNATKDKCAARAASMRN
jgi:hypothetical protein